jgi:hypothetical protein
MSMFYDRYMCKPRLRGEVPALVSRTRQSCMSSDPWRTTQQGDIEATGRRTEGIYQTINRDVQLEDTVQGRQLCCSQSWKNTDGEVNVTYPRNCHAMT